MIADIYRGCRLGHSRAAARDKHHTDSAGLLHDQGSRGSDGVSVYSFGASIRCMVRNGSSLRGSTEERDSVDGPQKSGIKQKFHIEMYILYCKTLLNLNLSCLYCIKPGNDSSNQRWLFQWCHHHGESIHSQQDQVWRDFEKYCVWDKLLGFITFSLK